MPASVLINNISKFILTPVIFLLFATAFVIFVWGVWQYVEFVNNPEARKKGGQHMLWGILGMFVMLSARYIVTILAKTIGANVPPGL